MKDIKVYAKSVYGKVRYFPANDLAHQIANLFRGAKCIPESKFDELKALGYKIIYVPWEPERENELV